MIYELRASALQHIFLNLFLMSLSINFLRNILMMLEAGVNEVCFILHIFECREWRPVHRLSLARGNGERSLVVPQAQQHLQGHSSSIVP